MPAIQYSLVSNGDTSNITVFVPGDQNSPYVAQDDHPCFQEIVSGAIDGDEAVVDLFDASIAAASRFEKLSERVAVANGRVYFDGDEVDNSLATQIVRFLSEGVEDFGPLVSFMENIAANPNDHSREQLFDWLNSRDFTITEDGLIVGYKGVHKNGDGSLVSGWAGTAIVDGEKVTGKIPNAIGSTIEMPRSSVTHDPSTACSYGLHVGTFSYARGYARGAMLEVHVNPRDVVSVPTDGGGEKVRVCRYTVVNVIDAPHTGALLTGDELDEDDDFFDDEDDDFFT
jgi:hypothetical protein